MSSFVQSSPISPPSTALHGSIAKPTARKTPLFVDIPSIREVSRHLESRTMLYPWQLSKLSFYPITNPTELPFADKTRSLWLHAPIC